MKSNESLQKDVQDAIKWEPLLNAAEIGVIAKDGVVTLSGTVDSYAKKIEAEDAAKNVLGVKAVVEKIEIQFASTWKKTDTEVATEVINAINANWAVDKDKVAIKVEDGWVTLEGELHWNYQKESAKKCISTLAGVKGVMNYIKIKPETGDEIEKYNIETALLRNWSIDDKDIKVEVLGNNVTLNGTVHSLYQKGEAERIAWNAPGVWSVDNELVVEHEEL
jgi:osmotically-inducible protein OsmY